MYQALGELMTGLSAQHPLAWALLVPSVVLVASGALYLLWELLVARLLLGRMASRKSQGR